MYKFTERRVFAPFSRWPYQIPTSSMKKSLFLAALLVMSSLLGFTQAIERDVFNDLKFESPRSGYKAYLKQNVFDDLTFSDSKDNRIEFSKKYLDLEYGPSLNTVDFFRDLIRTYKSYSSYKATYSVDIFGKVKIEDNRNGKVEYGTDIFGNPTYEESINGNKLSFGKDLSGALTFSYNGNTATLKENIFKKWVYEDSKGNRLELSSETFNVLAGRYGSTDNAFQYLINEFLLNR